MKIIPSYRWIIDRSQQINRFRRKVLRFINDQQSRPAYPVLGSGWMPSSGSRASL
ncbi:hypothetical protein JK203_14545 [Gluconobacter cerinus]|uniref:hypothetical protein n=1 Tax=Gluconobacter cerinus TaxID=38307 RepID=UPI001B8B1B91|nr:hypothetical protein [Gluconobacter cerinus]MBS1042053.1 hypothetical protein [Gluconobacter cerinus]MBS1048653.1 hypothetical protein [Gluconobacter cerinus]